MDTLIGITFIILGIFWISLIVFVIWKSSKSDKILRKTKNDDGVHESIFKVGKKTYHQRAGIRGDSQEGRELQKIFDDFDERVKKGEAKVYHEKDLR